jgi:hypothetical protein
MGDKDKTIVERMNDIVEAIDIYHRETSVPPANPPGTEEELNKYLNLTPQQLKDIPVEECSVVAYRLCQYSIYIQRLINKEKVRLCWADSQLTYILSIHHDNYKNVIAKQELKVQMVANENPAAQKLIDIIRLCNQRVLSLEYICSGLANMQTVLSNMQKSKIAQVYSRGKNEY